MDVARIVDIARGRIHIILGAKLIKQKNLNTKLMSNMDNQASICRRLYAVANRYDSIFGCERSLCYCARVRTAMTGVVLCNDG